MYFKKAFLTLREIEEEYGSGKFPEVFLVHGYELHTDIEIKQYMAWLEIDSEVLEFFEFIGDGHVYYNVIDKSDFYKKHKIRERMMYRYKDAMEEKMKHGHFGPWIG